MTLRYQKPHLLSVTALLAVLATGFGGETRGGGSTSAEEVTPVDTAQTGIRELPQWERVLRGDDLARVTELDSRMQELAEQARYAEAAVLAETTYAIRSRVLGPDHWETIFDRLVLDSYRRASTLSPELQTELAWAESVQRMHAEVGCWEPGDLERNRRMLEICRRTLGDEDLTTVIAMRQYGNALWFWGRASEGEAHYREALALARRLEGDDGLTVTIIKQRLCQLLMRQGKLVRQLMS